MIKLFLIGLIGGLLSGILGIGGGIVFVPLLTYLTKEDFKINTGISSLAIVFVASASAVSYIVNGLEIIRQLEPKIYDKNNKKFIDPNSKESRKEIGLIPGTHENWYASKLVVKSLKELKSISGITTNIF